LPAPAAEKSKPEGDQTTLLSTKGNGDPNIVLLSPEELDYGRRLLDHIGLPQKGNLVVVADSIRSFSKSKQLPLPVGFEQMRAIVDEALARSDLVDHLFFLNGRYNNLNPRSKFDVASDQLRDHLSGEFVMLDKQQSRAKSA
jgi:hypothetical protein